ncbi:MAG: hypothetical protein JWQ16_1611 [Novosphingobium sp.]|nr:hypothetical protein [Novosphingobium sp.]
MHWIKLMARKPPKTIAPAARRRFYTTWSRAFLTELAATSNVSAAARKARIPTTLVYAARRTDPEFNRQWRQALCEGYELLEMDLLLRMRFGELKPAPGAKRAGRTYNNAIALRLLGAHKETVSRQRAVRTNEDSETILLSINAKLERIRQQAIADGEIAPTREVAGDDAAAA